MDQLDDATEENEGENGLGPMDRQASKEIVKQAMETDLREDASDQRSQGTGLKIGS